MNWSEFAMCESRECNDNTRAAATTTIFRRTSNPQACAWGEDKPFGQAPLQIHSADVYRHERGSGRKRKIRVSGPLKIVSGCHSASNGFIGVELFSLCDSRRGTSKLRGLSPLYRTRKGGNPVLSIRIRAFWGSTWGRFEVIQSLRAFRRARRWAIGYKQ